MNKNFIKKNAEIDTAIKITIYFLKIPNQKVIDQIFDEFHKKKLE